MNEAEFAAHEAETEARREAERQAATVNGHHVRYPNPPSPHRTGRLTPDNVLDAMDAAQQTYCGADITAYDLRAKRGARPLSKSERGFACPDCLAVLDPKEQP